MTARRLRSLLKKARREKAVARESAALLAARLKRAETVVEAARAWAEAEDDLTEWEAAAKLEDALQRYYGQDPNPDPDPDHDDDADDDDD